MMLVRVVLLATFLFTVGRCGIGESCSHCYSRCYAEHGADESADECDATCGGACGN